MNDTGYGRLYVCPTPIGNLSDVTLRTLEVLKSVDVIACEDTRDSKKFLNHYDIHTPLTSYHQHNRASKGGKLITMMMEGKDVALISDAGMPGISDPGEDLIRECIDEGIEYYVLPGASAGITALVSSGLPTGRFVFEGFLPKIGKERKERLKCIGNESRTTILYESPHHLVKTLEDLSDAAGSRRLTIVREISKKFEEKIYTDTTKAPVLFKEKDPKGEFVLVLEGKSEEETLQENREKFADVSIEDHVKMYENKGYKRNEAMKMAAADLGIKKRDVYNMLLEKEAPNE